MEENDRVRIVWLPVAFGSDEVSEVLGIFVRTRAGYLQIGVIRPWQGRFLVRITAAKELLAITYPFVFHDYEREGLPSIADAEADARAFLRYCREDFE
jgi:hypothetical protein